MSRRVVNLGFAFGAMLLLAFMASRLLPSLGSGDAGAPAPPASAPPSPSLLASPSPTLAAAGTARAVPVEDAATRSYAVKVVELQGLPPNVPPGTALELWVAWEPPLTPEPQYELLLPRVVLERVIPGITPEAPATAVLRVKESQLPELLYGDRYGAFSVAVLPAG